MFLTCFFFFLFSLPCNLMRLMHVIQRHVRPELLSSFFFFFFAMSQFKRFFFFYPVNFYVCVVCFWLFPFFSLSHFFFFLIRDNCQSGNIWLCVFFFFTRVRRQRNAKCVGSSAQWDDVSFFFFLKRRSQLRLCQRTTFLSFSRFPPHRKEDIAGEKKKRI